MFPPKLEQFVVASSHLLFGAFSSRKTWDSSVLILRPPHSNRELFIGHTSSTQLPKDNNPQQPKTSASAGNPYNPWFPVRLCLGRATRPKPLLHVEPPWPAPAGRRWPQCRRRPVGSTLCQCLGQTQGPYLTGDTIVGFDKFDVFGIHKDSKLQDVTGVFF